MSVVDQIIEKTQFTETIDGLEFRLRLITAEIAARVIGNKVLGLMRAGTSSREVPKAEVERITREYLELCMVSPKLGTVSSPGNDVISLEDLGLYGEKILLVVFERSGFEGLGNLASSSEATEAKTSVVP